MTHVRWQEYSWGVGLVGFFVALIWGIWGSNPIWQPIVETDIDQHRIDVALPTPRNDIVIRQSFVPRWNGLREVEVTLVRYGEKETDENGRLTFQLLDESNTVIAEDSLATAPLEHNQTYRMGIPLQTRSAGRTYTLQISGDANNDLSVWGYTLDTYQAGNLVMQGGALQNNVPETTAKTLRFLTRYQLGWADVWASLGTAVFYEAIPLLLTLLLIPLPGVLLFQVLKRTRWPAFGTPLDASSWDYAAYVGTCLALGLSIWPLLWFWLTMLGGHWAGWSLWLVVVLGWVCVAVLWWRARKEPGEQESDDIELPKNLRWSWESWLLLLLLAVGLGARLLAVRELSFPPWVDASRHGLITAVMSHSGQIPITYAPFLPVSQFPYHFGFHTLASSLQLMTSWPLERLLLYLGQLLNGLVPLMLFTAVWHLTRQRGSALFAAFLVALPFFFPAYYATWGRFTQLTAMLIMPVLLAFTWLVLRDNRWRVAWWLVGILAAGLSYVHFRVFLFYIPFVLVAGFVTLGKRQWGQRILWLLAGVALAIGLAGPRLWQLWRMDNPSSRVTVQIGGYNAFPTSYVTTGWERYYLWAAAVGLLGTLIWYFATGYARRKNWAILPTTLVGWVAVLFVLLAGERLGLPETGLVNTNSMYITLFVPLAIFLSLLFAQLWQWLRRQHWLIKLPTHFTVGVLIAWLFLFGLHQQIGILNPQTILAKPEDVVAIRWLEQNLPQDAQIAVNSWPWLGSTWAASDGGAWLVPLTGRAASTPPADYIYETSLALAVLDLNEQLTAVDNWYAPETADLLRDAGYTHIFVGARGGFFDPATLAQNPQLDILFQRDGVFVFEIN